MNFLNYDNYKWYDILFWFKMIGNPPNVLKIVGCKNCLHLVRCIITMQIVEVMISPLLRFAIFFLVKTKKTVKTSMGLQWKKKLILLFRILPFCTAYKNMQEKVIVIFWHNFRKHFHSKMSYCVTKILKRAIIKLP